ncbi:hypothetical protein AB1L07_02330 [Niallia alba]|uniref:hypothetical protein n=1 Tax=Niallia alba TaxID=2729105 RepID=UPI0039A2F849
MADLTKCSNKKCEMKEICYRNTATDNIYAQSYAYFEAKDGEECEYFIPDNK